MSFKFVVNDDIHMHIEYKREIREARHGFAGGEYVL